MRTYTHTFMCYTGNGGSVILTVDTSINTLFAFRGKTGFKADHGMSGDMDYANGLAGANCYVAVPRGTVVRDNVTGEVVGELTDASQQLLVAAGGLGGRGNAALRTKGEKSTCTPPEGGVNMT